MSDIFSHMKAADLVNFIKEQVGTSEPQTTLKTRILPYDLEQANDDIAQASEDESLYFNDGQRRIDMVLAYQDTDDEEDEERHESVRETFHENLEKAGLQLEVEHKETTFDRKTHFVKIHAPTPVLEKWSDLHHMKHPIKEYILTFYSVSRGGNSTTQNNSRQQQQDSSKSWWFSDQIVKSIFNCETIPPEPKIFAPGFMPDIMDKYVLKQRWDELSSIQRTQIVWQIMSRVRYNNTSREKSGVQRLISKRVYNAAFPLHEGAYDYGNEVENIKLMNERRLLYLEWASLRCWYRKQPLWLIKKYFGVKIGLYFAWLGFYTQMLIIPAVVGIVCFLFGCITVGTSLNQVSRDVCDASGVGNITMCPQCDQYCPYWKLVDSCVLSRVTYLFDNNITVIFSIFMSIWATSFLEVWKRRQAILQWEWDLGNEDDAADEIRAEFETQVKTTRLNPITQKQEAFVPGKEKIARLTLTYSIVLFMLFLVAGAFFSVLIFRIMIIQFMYETTARINFFGQYSRIIATSCAASIQAVVIELSGWLFQYVARMITTWEHPRTQADYENSYTFKMFLFQFINYYSSLIYTAFFKGRFFTYPGDAGSRHDWISRMKTDMCDPAGCIYELCLMLGIYMIGRQLASNTMELYYPKIKNWLRSVLVRYQRRQAHISEQKEKLRRWEADYCLEELDRLHLFDEYIEMVIQYGFVTLFVASFPLAPVLALINNVFEIRLDAYKYTTQMRRPLGQQVKSIGIWYGIMEGMTYLSVVFNAFVIALSSDFVERMVYIFVYSPNFSLEGYLEHTLAEFRTLDWGAPNNGSSYFGPQLPPNVTQQPYDTCRYRAYREAPNHPDEYEINKTWLHVFVGRLAFVAVFEHFVLVLNSILAYVIPDVPNNLSTQLLREKQLEQELVYTDDEDDDDDGCDFEDEELTDHDAANGHVINEDLEQGATTEGGDDGHRTHTKSSGRRKQSMSLGQALRRRTAGRARHKASRDKFHSDKERHPRRKSLVYSYNSYPRQPTPGRPRRASVSTLSSTDSSRRPSASISTIETNEELFMAKTKRKVMELKRGKQHPDIWEKGADPVHII